MKAFLRKYSENTSIHGVQYVGHAHRTYGERICWIIILVISSICCVSLIGKLYGKWHGDPILITIDSIPRSTASVRILFQPEFQYIRISSSDTRTVTNILSANEVHDGSPESDCLCWRPWATASDQCNHFEFRQLPITKLDRVHVSAE